MADVIDQSYTDAFEVNANLYGTSGTISGFLADATVTGISTDDETFTPVTATYPPFSSMAATVTGRFLVFSANPDGTGGQRLATDSQSLIDQINANKGNTTALTDTFYYRQQLNDGSTLTEQIDYALNDVHIAAPSSAPYSTPATVDPLSSTNIGGVTVHQALSSGQASDAAEVMAVTVGLFNFDAQHAEGRITLDPTQEGAGAGGTVLQAADLSSLTITGTVSQINADLQGLTYIAPANGSDYITVQAVDGPATTADFIVGEVLVACYLAGTRIATDRGERPVEELVAGDLVQTAEGTLQPVRWMGHRTVRHAAGKTAEAFMPVRIRAGALGAAVPVRDLLVSPDHGVLVGDVLVQAGALVNGITVLREAMPGDFTYWHVDLATHELILADGTPAETFVDNAGRMAFDNWAEDRAAGGPDAPRLEMPWPRVQAQRQVPHRVRSLLAARVVALAGGAPREAAAAA